MWRSHSRMSREDWNLQELSKPLLHLLSSTLIKSTSEPVFKNILGIHDYLFNDVRIIREKTPRDIKNRSKYGYVRIAEFRIIGIDLWAFFTKFSRCQSKFFKLRCSNNRTSNYTQSLFIILGAKLYLLYLILSVQMRGFIFVKNKYVALIGFRR